MDEGRSFRISYRFLPNAGSTALWLCRAVFFALTDEILIIAEVLYKPVVLELRFLANMPKCSLLLPGCMRIIAYQNVKTVWRGP